MMNINYFTILLAFGVNFYYTIDVKKRIKNEKKKYSRI